MKVLENVGEYVSDLDCEAFYVTVSTMAEKRTKRAKRARVGTGKASPVMYNK